MKTLAQHTPGPWYTASTGNHQGLIISQATGANVAVAYDKLDAPLLAAAPDMLDAAKALMSAYDEGVQSPHIQKYWRDLKDAIAKAVTP